MRNRLVGTIGLLLCIAFMVALLWAAGSAEQAICRNADYEDGEQLTGYCAEVLDD